MEFKGTKGKWYLKGRTNLSVHCIAVENEIELVYPVAKIDDFDKSVQQNKANALLMSKAPEMLEMLKKLIDRFENMPNMGLLQKIDVQDAKQLIKEATEL